MRANLAAAHAVRAARKWALDLDIVASVHVGLEQLAHHHEPAAHARRRHIADGLFCNAIADWLRAELHAARRTLVARWLASALAVRLEALCAEDVAVDTLVHETLRQVHTQRTRDVLMVVLLERHGYSGRGRERSW